MKDTIELSHERVDDIPLIIGLAQHLHLPEVLDRHLGNHGHHQGLSNGWLATIWLTYILTEGDHRKSSVQDWVDRHQQTLERLLMQPLRAGECNDDRLGIVLQRLSRPKAWQELEAELWASTVTVYEVAVEGVRLDSTTTCGYHSTSEEGLMQYGHSKDHRADLAQVKVMAAAAQPSGHLLACDVHAGQRADDPLYSPLIARVRKQLGRTGVLYAGDSKMAALATRADIVAHGDFYLVPLPLTGQTGEQLEQWIEAAVKGTVTLEQLEQEGEILFQGYELSRPQCAQVGDQTIHWTERVQLVGSQALAQRQHAHYEQRLVKAEAALRALTPPPGRGKRQFRDEVALQTAVAEVQEQHGVTGALRVRWQREVQEHTHYVGRGRGSAQRATQTQQQVRYVITEIERDEAFIQTQQQHAGWRVQVSNMPSDRLTWVQTVQWYGEGWCLERDFHLLKDRPLGIRPLYVRRDDQITGLTHLLTLALRLLSLLETQVRQGLAQAGERLSGLYPEQPNRSTDRPTATRLLKVFARAEITLTCMTVGTVSHWHLTPLSAPLLQILAYLQLSPSIYTRLVENSS
jgi:transposase